DRAANCYGGFWKHLPCLFDQLLGADRVPRRNVRQHEPPSLGRERHLRRLSCRRMPRLLGPILLLMLDLFRLNSLLLTAGDRLVARLGLTSARWQILGAIVAADHPPTELGALPSRHASPGSAPAGCTLKCTLSSGISGDYRGRGRKAARSISVFEGRLRSRRVFGGLRRLVSKTGGCRFDSCRACKSRTEWCGSFSPGESLPPSLACARDITARFLPGLLAEHLTPRCRALAALET